MVEDEAREDSTPTLPVGSLGRQMDEDRSDWLSGLVEQHARMVFATAYRILGRADEAEDVLQDVFIKVLGVGNGQPPDAVRDWGAYLRTAASRTAINRLRQRQRWRVGIPASRTEPVAESKDRTVQERHAALLEQAVGQLPGRDAEVFSLRYLEEFSYEQIADQMNLSTNQVGVILHRARKRLRKILLRMGVSEGE